MSSSTPMPGASAGRCTRRARWSECRQAHARAVPGLALLQRVPFEHEEVRHCRADMAGRHRAERRRDEVGRERDVVDLARCAILRLSERPPHFGTSGITTSAPCCWKSSRSPNAGRGSRRRRSACGCAHGSASAPRHSRPEPAPPAEQIERLHGSGDAAGARHVVAGMQIDAEIDVGTDRVARRRHALDHGAQFGAVDRVLKASNLAGWFRSSISNLSAVKPSATMRFALAAQPSGEPDSSSPSPQSA